MSQQFHSYVYIQKNRKHVYKQKLIHRCSWQHYLKQSKSADNLMPINGWMNNKNKHIHMMLYATTEKNFRKIMLSERSQVQKMTYYNSIYMKYL